MRAFAEGRGHTLLELAMSWLVARTDLPGKRLLRTLIDHSVNGIIRLRWQDSDGADKATRFMQLCDAHDLPLLFLCDTPGIMVGPEIEKTALVREGLKALIERESARRLVRLGGSQPDIRAPVRRRSEPG